MGIKPFPQKHSGEGYNALIAVSARAGLPERA